jgi:hypothetical protein
MQLASDIWQFNVTFQDHSSLISLGGGWNFPLLQLTIQIDELNMAIQNTLVGKLPVAILKPCFTQYFMEYILVTTREI